MWKAVENKVRREEKKETGRCKRARTARRVTATVMALAVGVQLCGGSVLYVHAEEASAESAAGQAADAILSDTALETDAGKQEVVYVKTDASGQVTDVTVSDWLKNTGNKKELDDVSNLKDIANVKGDETYTAGADGTLRWAADGADIYYQGKSEEALPVDIKLSYFLDGKAIQPDKLAGQSGKVTIRFDYTNHCVKTVEIDGEEEEIYTPFLMASAVILPEEHFKNVEVTNGKVISDGKNQIVIGTAFPGLEDSLKLDELDLDDRDKIPDYVEITADASEFELSMTATVATCGQLEKLGLSDIDSVDELEDALDDLSEASRELVDGSQELLDGVLELKDSFVDFKDGLDTLDEKTQELKDGAEEIKEGVQEYTAGADTLSDGVTGYVDGTDTMIAGVGSYLEGASSLQQGIGTLAEATKDLPASAAGLDQGVGLLKQGSAQMASEKSAQLVQGSKKVAAGISSLNTQLTALYNAASSIPAVTSEGGVTADLSQAEGAVNGSTDANNTAIGQLQAIQSSLSDLQSQLYALTDEEGNPLAQSQADALSGQIDAISSAIGNIQSANNGQSNAVALMQQEEGRVNNAGTDAGIENAANPYASLAQGLGELVQATAADQALQTGADAVAGGVETMYNGAVELDDGLATLKESTEKLSEGAATLAGAGEQLAEGANNLTSNNETLAQGARKLTEAGSQLKTGSASLKENSSKLNQGAKTLAEGSGKLKDGTAELADAGVEVSDGIGELSDGTQELADGMNEFDEDGIQELTGKEADLARILDRLHAVEDADREYQIFTQLADGMTGSVSFIMESESIKE